MFGEVLNLQSDLEYLITSAEKMKTQIYSFEWAALAAAAFAAVLSIIVIMLMVNVVLVWTKRISPPFRCLHSYLFYPLFIGSLALCWLFATIFILGALMSSDFCVDSPDPKVKIIMESYLSDNFSSLAFGFIAYYVSGCKEHLKPDQMEDLSWALRNLLSGVHGLINLIGSVPTDELAALCQINGTDASRVNNASFSLDSQLHTYADLLQDTRQVFFCENFNPIYTRLTHNALCYNGTRALAWFFWTQLSIAILSMVIVTIRAAWDDSHMNEGEAKDVCETPRSLPLKLSGGDHDEEGKEDTFQHEGSDQCMKSSDLRSEVKEECAPPSAPQEASREYYRVDITQGTPQKLRVLQC
mmetsp:Transcript_57332/g.170994  ORF Transcript_57332/g.170994 Transcript_57332/m.170994 type:complete len:356 (-) Transcript_57332:206-1273(-)